MTFGVTESARLALCIASFITRGGGDGAIDPSSVFLKLHRQYQYPPHDMTLYDVLNVRSNSTMADITKSYRRLSREYHPDKRGIFLKKRKRIRKAKNGNTREVTTDENVTSDDVAMKTSSSSKSEAEEEEDPDFLLEKIRQAYEVLKDDVTRLPYHKFGLMDTSTAALLLTRGAFDSGDALSWEQRRLLQLMGFTLSSGHEGLDQYYSYSGDGRDSAHQERVRTMASNLIETLRPLVEDVVSQEDICQAISTECDRLKSLPLGSQILRCVGRAYRHSGQRALRRYHRNRKLNKHKKLSPLRQPLQVGLDLSDDIRDALRNARQVATAAVASGKLILTEKQNDNSIQSVNKKAWKGGLSVTPEVAPPSAMYDCHHNAHYSQKEQDNDMTHVDRIFANDSEEETDILDNQMHKINVEDGIEKIWDGSCSIPQTQIYPECESPSSTFEMDTVEYLRQKEQAKAKKAILRTLEVDALWKIYKIQLDRSVREACSLILNSKYAFLPAKLRRIQHEATSYRNGDNGYVPHLDGWVSPYSGQIIGTNVGRIRAAAAMILVGDTMVKCSKENTSWKNKDPISD